MNQSPIIDRNDFAFFFTLGLLVSCFTMLSAVVPTPEQMDRGYLVSLYFDHVPFTTIVVLLVALSIFQSSAIFLRNYSITNFLSRQCIHLSNRISQFCSPASFITIGLAVPPFVRFLYSKEDGYLTYSIAFTVFAIVLVFIAWAAAQFANVTSDQKENLSPRWALSINVVIVVLIAMVLYFDDSPKTVSIKLDLNKFEELKLEANQQEISVEELILRKMRNHN
jgi:hypothetical protein